MPVDVERAGEIRSVSDELAPGALWRKTRYRVRTADGWSLAITRYRPLPQPFPQPIFGEPILLVHGFSQNRRAWEAGGMVRRLVRAGADLHLLELRGHGHSGIDEQRRIAALEGRPEPADLDYGWDLDSYLLDDLPAAIDGVKKRTGRARIFYCGHSMGGILGYGHAGLHDDFEGLVTLGAAAELGRGFGLLQALSRCAPAVSAAIDLAFDSVNARRRLSHSTRRTLLRAGARLGRRAPEALPAFEPVRFRYVPVDTGLRWLGVLSAQGRKHRVLGAVARRVNWLSNPDRVDGDALGRLLREGCERETRAVVEQFARWIREGRMRCERTGYDFQDGFRRIRIPAAVLFGDRDPLATAESTRAVVHAAPSAHLLWRPVKGNRHIELTMGHDVDGICRDIEAVIDRARRIRHEALAAG